MSSWLPSWMVWGDKGPTKPMHATDAMHHPSVRMRFSQYLDNIDPPKSFRAAEVAQEFTYDELVKLGYKKWEEIMPAVIELAFEMRAIGHCEILKGGKVLGDDVTSWDIQGSANMSIKLVLGVAAATKSGVQGAYAVPLVV
ncbi:hypothetical protein LTR37_019087 [Vermiconidia calcicola]|uniref:Uncharacterized protein n=1 Tax=Vermiconidia calcicola TaxID=1690605 RepID=A0ACC3MI35_9PEZI|nr:hypothetical protein LTR37_019087 [Vermiconidia calcicola]